MKLYKYCISETPATLGSGWDGIGLWIFDAQFLLKKSMFILFLLAKPPLDVQVTTHKHNVTISWSKPETAPLPAAYVVEWYPVGHKLQELRWFRLGGNDNHVVITGGRCGVKVNTEETQQHYNLLCSLELIFGRHHVGLCRC